MKDSIRAFGQRSLASFCSPNRAKDSVGESHDKGSSISLSVFLDRKLQRNSTPPGTVQGKSRPFSSPVNLKDIINGQKADSKGRETEIKSGPHTLVFEHLKNTCVEKGDCVELDSSNIVEVNTCVEKGDCVEIDSSNIVEVGTSVIDDLQGSRKRKNPFEGWEKKHVTRKGMVVLGGDSKYDEHITHEVTFARNKKQRPIYNHYANGGGWWDNDMEGIDSGEVGSTEVWEGVGSTTFEGVIDWH